MHLFLLGNARLRKNHNFFAPYHFFIIKSCACEYLLKIGDALCNTTTWTRFGICKRIKKIERISVKFIIAQYWILYAKKRRNIRRKKLWRRIYAPSCRFKKRVHFCRAQHRCSHIAAALWHEKYMPKHVYPMKQLQLSGSDTNRQNPPAKRFFSHAHAFPNKRRLCAPLKYMRYGAMPY